MNKLDTLVDAFDVLSALPASDRAARLAELQLDAAQVTELMALLAADNANAADPAQLIERAAQRLGEQTQATATTQIGPWRIVRELGSGGMGTVLLAERSDGAYAQQVALKLLRGFPTEEGKRRLRAERQLLAQLDHPNIARLIDGGESSDGQPYLVIEFVDGLPITRWVAKKRLDLRARLSLFDAVCVAVSHAHQHLIVHRDLKPSNVYVRADGIPKLLDFGIAKLIDLNLDESQTSTQSWTPGYASPEQELGLGVARVVMSLR